MEIIYNTYSPELKDYIQFSCPFKIGDRVRINSIYRGYTSTDEVIHYGQITDIQVTTKRQILFRNGLNDILKLLDDKKVTTSLDEPVGEFTLIYTYSEKIRRKNRWKFWITPEYREVTSSITIDAFGNNVQRASTVRKIIEKE